MWDSKSFKCWVRCKRKSKIFVCFESILTFLKSQGKEVLELGKVDPGYLCVKMQCISCCGVGKMCVKFTNGWMNLAISHDVRNIHSYFGKGRRQKHNLLLSCPQATHKLEQAVCFYLEGVVSRFSLTVQRVRRLGNLVCRKNTLTHKREINWDTSWSSGTHTAMQKKKQSMIFPCIFLFTLHAQFYVHELFIFGFLFAILLKILTTKKFWTRKFADFKNTVILVFKCTESPDTFRQSNLI